MILRGIDLETTERLISKKVRSIETMFVARIERFDHVNGKADITPITKLENSYGELIDKSMIIECPVLTAKTSNFYIRFPYEVGDLIYVGCSKEALDNLLITGETVEDTLSSMPRFRMSDAVVLGGLFHSQETKMLNTNKSDLVVVNRNTGESIKMKKDGGMEISLNSDLNITAPNTIINTELSVNGNVNISGTTTSGEVVTEAGIDLNTHTHKYTHNTPLDRVTDVPQ
jgi:hypothetical protein